MKSLFDKTCIKTMELKNRFVRSATWEAWPQKKDILRRDYLIYMKN